MFKVLVNEMFIWVVFSFAILGGIAFEFINSKIKVKRNKPPTRPEPNIIYKPSKVFYKESLFRKEIYKINNLKDIENTIDKLQEKVEVQENLEKQLKERTTTLKTDELGRIIEVHGDRVYRTGEMFSPEEFDYIKKLYLAEVKEYLQELKTKRDIYTKTVNELMGLEDK